jgi:hypothetical protein
LPELLLGNVSSSNTTVAIEQFTKQTVKISATTAAGAAVQKRELEIKSP